MADLDTNLVTAKTVFSHFAFRTRPDSPDGIVLAL
jgi:hypothetical protein